MPDAAGVVIGVYSPEESEEALALERLCVQGISYRLSFRRSTFHRRAENFPEWRIFTARLEGRLVGVAAGAVKEVLLHGQPTRASFFFDLRVHPAFRGRGIARRLAVEAKAWGRARASFSYTYTLADNRVARHLAEVFGGVAAGGYAYLVYPVYRVHPSRDHAAPGGFREVHDAMLAASGPLDLYADPQCAPGRGGYVASWILRRGKDLAGCSAWSNRGILGEVVESIPLPLRLASRLAATWPLRRASWPHFPAPGEELRSWYLFDFFATHPSLARDLMRQVAGKARDYGIDYCYLPHDSRDRWLGAVRSDLPRLFGPIIPYRLLVGGGAAEARPLDRTYVDVRDL